MAKASIIEALASIIEALASIIEALASIIAAKAAPTALTNSDLQCKHYRFLCFSKYFHIPV
jgi:hypothetical protein